MNAFWESNSEVMKEHRQIGIAGVPHIYHYECASERESAPSEWESENVKM
jgi:hypothetical protein